jgi:tetraacyldisaccharide 4'-kinase
MNKTFARWIEDVWYRDMYLAPLLVPFSLLYLDGIRLRRFLYRSGFKNSVELPVPVIVVGNITVGGTGKTPLVIWLSQWLRQQGYRPGVVSRGYLGANSETVQSVTADSDPSQVGDEAVVLARRCACPVVIGAKRTAAARQLLAEHACNIVISDDGLQHYALQRDLEIAVIDGRRRFGNGYLLPAGPLREPLSRLREVDLVVVNGGEELEDGEFAMNYRGDEMVNLLTGEQRPLASFCGQSCRAVAAVGNPQGFFSQLERAGLSLQVLSFPDHHAFQAHELDFPDELPLLMTEKDAVKCRRFAKAHHWYLPVQAELPESFSQQLLKRLSLLHG